MVTGLCVVAGEALPLATGAPDGAGEVVAPLQAARATTVIATIANLIVRSSLAVILVSPRLLLLPLLLLLHPSIHQRTVISNSSSGFTWLAGGRFGRSQAVTSGGR
jgi:hypothetical protein